MLMDEEHTSMWVSYSVNLTENMMKMLGRAAGSNGFEFENGVMCVGISKENAAECLMSMI